MVLQIKTTGIEDYIDGSSNIKMLVIGGPGVGKTRMSSYWPKPIYADTEKGRASIADRAMPYAEIKNSKDMLDLLSYLKKLEAKPKADRPYSTIVVDTLDGFQRSVADEWLQQTGAASFKGFDAWGYLDTKMQMLMTRLLNLDYNVVVLVHYKDKMVDDVAETQLQLKGDIRDTAFNDFDLVGWLDTTWGTKEGERVEQRTLTFKRTPKKPFLKDRFGVMPDRLPVEFADSDYGQLMDAWLSKVDTLTEGQTVDEVPDAEPDVPKGKAVGPLDGGPLGGRAASGPTKAELMDRARALGLKPAGNTLKGELEAMIEKAEAEPPAPPDPPADPQEDAVALLGAQLGAKVIAETPPEAETPAPVAVPERACADCGKDLADEDAKKVRIGWVKYKKLLCNEHYETQAKA